MAERNITEGLSDRALDTIDMVVATVHDKVVRPAVVGARAVVFGMIIGVVGIAMAIFLSVGFIRLTTVYLFDHKVWISYFALGGLFCAVGAFAYRKRVAPPSDG
ncbi:MAG TPA: hypothetical protein VNG12_20635 [Acidimicrobiales bacterium]|nr:hypothetical protein [Acidimicrobiales bacterium]